MLNRISNIVTAGVFHQQQEQLLQAKEQSQQIAAAEVATPIEPATLSTDMSRVNAPFNKYSSMIDTHSSIKPKRTETLYEQVFGKDATEFDMLKDSFLARQSKASQRQ